MTEPSLQNPYLAARQEWNERYGSYIRQASHWRIVGLTSLAIALVGFSYALYQSTQIKLVPYIVEVDHLGNSVSGGIPQQIEYADPRVVRASLANFIASFRSVTPDTVVQKQYIDRSYALLRSGDPATEKINAWFRTNSPFERARTLTVAIEVTNIVPLSSQSFQVDWTEYDRDRQGKELAVRRFRGIANVTLTPPRMRASFASTRLGSISKISTGPRSFDAQKDFRHATVQRRFERLHRRNTAGSFALTHFR